MYDDLIKQLRYCADATTCRNCFWKTECCPTDMQKKAADAIEELRKAVLRLEDESGIYDELPTFYIYPTKWISVEERLPEPNAVDKHGFAKGYLVKTDRHVMMHTARYNGEWWVLWGQAEVITDTVTHWMPLPEPPKEGE